MLFSSSGTIQCLVNFVMTISTKIETTSVKGCLLRHSLINEPQVALTLKVTLKMVRICYCTAVVVIIVRITVGDR